MKVRVKYGVDIIDERECRRVALPEGREAAIWRGLAFPLVDGTIDAAGEGVAPELCRDPEVVGPAPSAYALHMTIGGAYVLLGGSVIQAENAAAHLKRAGLEVLRTGRYVGEVLPGFDADWFIRVGAEAGEDLDPRIAAALGAPAQSAEPQSDLRERLIAVELERALARAEATKAELERLRHSANEFAQWRDSTSHERGVAEAEREARQAAERRAAEAQRRLDDLLAERVSRPEPATQRNGRRIVDEIADVLSSLLPRIRLVRDTPEVVATEFLSRLVVYRALGELDRATQGIPSEWKAVKGAAAWIERHVSTGQDNAGRAYARLDKSDRRWNVLISFKSDQPRDIEWLKRN